MPPNTERWQRIAAWFDELAELAPAARAERLAAIATDDPAAAAEVSALLDADARDGVLDSSITTALPDLATDSAAPEDGRAGPYRLLRVIGEGGMGAVFLAERSDGSYEQQVAVKLIKRGMDSVAIVRRFLRERSILARLAHPNIVRLLDGGMSADGRPYYAMEYVDGRTITEHAGATHLSPKDRVRLVAEVAETVAYAHAQLVVHRDLKPSNVLVDREGRPRVLDFGIAKLLEGSTEDDRTLTATGARVLSPAYAAPEQVLGETIGTATDVFALGLVLCELLTGRLPVRGTEPDAEPERASAIAASRAPTEIAALYGDGVSPAQIARQLRGDVDVMIATALQRQPSRRYPTAAAFADDLRRWLDGRPIAARADSRAYRFSKFVRRHRVAVAAAVLIALSVLGGLGASLWQARIARAEAQRADAERAHAERQLARTERVKDFVLTLFREQDPISRAKAQARSAPELIRDGIAQIDATFASEDALRAELLRDLGEIQVGLDDSKAGEATLKRALDLEQRVSGADSAASAEAMAAYADGIYAAGDADKADAMMRDAVTRLRATHGADHVKTAKAESSLAVLEMIRGRDEEAERLAQHAVAIYRATYGADDPEVAQRLSVLGNIQQEVGTYDKALATFDQALDIIARTQGKDHVRTVMLRSRKGDVLRVQRKFDEALDQYRTALDIERAQLPAQHVVIGGTLLRLGDLERRAGRLDAADRSFAEAIAILSKKPSGQYAQALQFHGDLAHAQGRFDVALQRYRAALDTFRERTGESVYTRLTALKVVETLTDLERLDEAEKLGVEISAAIAATSKEDSYESAYAAAIMGELRHIQGRDAEAVPLLRRTLALLVKIYDNDHAEIATGRVALAAGLIGLRDEASRAEASTLLEAAKASLERGGADDTDGILGKVYLERCRLRLDNGDADGARADIAEALKRLQTPEHAPTLRRARTLERRLETRA